MLFIILSILASPSLSAADWEVITKTEQSLTFRVISFLNGQFVGAGDDGFLRTSANGKTWTAISHNKARSIYNIKYYKGLYIAVGRDELIETSPDLVNWTVRNPSFPNVNSLIGLAYNGSDTIVAAGIKGTVWVSSNGTDWTKINSGFNFEIWELVYAENKFVGVGSAGHTVTSTDGLNWTPKKLPTSANLYGLVHGAGKFVLTGADGACFTSPDGKSWTKRDPDTYAHLMEVTYNGSDFVAVGDGNEGCTRIIVSPDGINWVKDKIDKSFGNITRTMTAVESGNGFVVAGGARYRIVRNSFGGIGDGNGCPAKGPNPNPNPTPTGPTITITTPGGAVSWKGGVTYAVKWKTTGTVDTVDIEYTVDNGKTYQVLVKDTANDGQHAWTLPKVNSSGCRLWVNGIGPQGNDIDFSDYFSIYTSSPTPPGTIKVTSPNGGEIWNAGDKHDVTWTSTGAIANVKILYSTTGGGNWKTVTSTTPNNGTYSWTLPNLDSTVCRLKIIDTANAPVYDVNDANFSITPAANPALQVSKASLNFGLVSGSSGSASQTVIVSNTGGGVLNWSASADVNWLDMSPSSASGGALVNISAQPAGLAPGQYTGTITFGAPGADNSPQSLSVSLKVIDRKDDQPPFGLFATPLDGTTGVSGSIPVTGWALDDAGIDNVKIYRRVDNRRSWIGDAVLVEGARDDVKQAYPGYPGNSRAGWGYMLLTNFLPDGQLILEAVATDTSGQSVSLGIKTVYLDNQNAREPYGAIDAPTQGGIASGKAFVNWGWVLTPNPNFIPYDGSTINVWVNGKSLGHPTYNIYREDIAGKFPGLANSDGAIGYLYIDTTTYPDGVHTIEWSARDSAGNTQGIGSCYFTIQNGGASEASTPNAISASARIKYPAGAFKKLQEDGMLLHASNHASSHPVQVGLGLDHRTPLREVYPDTSGLTLIESRELQRIMLQLAPTSPEGLVSQIIPLTPMPIGSTLAPAEGSFLWQPGAGFYGKYRLKFLVKPPNRTPYLRDILIDIRPK